MDDVRDGLKPVLDQVGPYVYRKWRERQDVEFNREGLVSFADSSWITPYPDPSGRDPSVDIIATVNLPLMGVLRSMELKLNGTVQRLAELTLAELFADRGKREGLFMRRSATELLVGYEDELLATLARLVPTLSAKVSFHLVDNMTDISLALENPRTVMQSGTTRPLMHMSFYE